MGQELSAGWVPHNNLGFIYVQLGQYEKALTETQQSQHLEPNLIGYTNLAGIYLALNRTDDAEKMIEQAQERKFEGDVLHSMIYQLAFMGSDRAEMDRQVAWAAGKPGTEDQLFSSQAET